jgi:imidazolonepropionase-like amidohydrolase
MATTSDIEAMVNFCMPLIDALRSATSINARVLRIDDKAGMVKAGLLADLIAVEGDPRRLICVRFIIKGGVIYRTPLPLGCGPARHPCATEAEQ